MIKLPLLCWCLHLVVVEELEYPSNLEGYAIGSLALAGPPLAERSKGRGQTKRGTLVLQVWGLSVGLTLQPWKKFLLRKLME